MFRIKPNVLLIWVYFYTSSLDNYHFAKLPFTFTKERKKSKERKKQTLLLVSLSVTIVQHVIIFAEKKNMAQRG